MSYWIYIYENILKNYKVLNNIQFLAYEKFNLDIVPILRKFDLNIIWSEKFEFKNNNKTENLKKFNFDEKLKIKAQKIYRELENLQINQFLMQQ